MPLLLTAIGPKAELVEVVGGEDSQGEECRVLGDGRVALLNEFRPICVGLYPPETVLGPVAMAVVFPLRRGGDLGWQSLNLGQSTIVWRKDSGGACSRGLQITPLPYVDLELNACRFDDF